MLRMPLVSIDVGLNALGWALWVARPKGRPAPPDECGVVKAPRRLPRWPRLLKLIGRFNDKLSEVAPYCGTMAAEEPNFRASNAVGHSAASRGDLGMLYAALGAHAWQAEVEGIDFVPVPVREWKGQLPKRVVTDRLTRAIGVAAIDGVPIESHAWDAVGIGLHVMGFKLDDAALFGRNARRR